MYISTEEECISPASLLSYKSKGYFAVPPENMTRGQWQEVIQEEISSSTRVCFRHWAQEHLELTAGGKVFPKEGKSVYES